MPASKNPVNQKLQTAEGLQRSMVEQLHQRRAFVLELLVMIILGVEFFALFYGKPL